MNEIKCPKCGEVFQVDESGYAAIIKQVRDQEFQKEIEARQRLIDEERKSAIDAAVAKAQADKDAEIAKLKSDLDQERTRGQQLEEKSTADIKAIEEKAAVAIKNTEERAAEQIKNTEERAAEQIKNTEERAALQVKSAEEKAESKIRSAEEKANSEKIAALAQKDSEIVKLQSQLDFTRNNTAIEVKNAVLEKDADINRLKSQMEIQQKDYELKESTMNDLHKQELARKDELIESYKDFKARLSTKMLGETLEQHCEISFNNIRAAGFKNAYFEKDNDSRYHR